jgi:hypothetical protein
MRTLSYAPKSHTIRTTMNELDSLWDRQILLLFQFLNFSTLICSGRITYTITKAAGAEGCEVDT